MLKAMLRGLLAHKLRLLLSALAIVLGTAFMSAAFVGGDTISKGFTEMFSQINENLDVQVTAKSDAPQPQGGSDIVTAVVPKDVADRLETVDGVEHATPQVISDGARVIDKNGKAVPSTGPPRFGIGWPTGPGDQPLVVMREGQPPTAPDQVAISKNLADVTGYQVGDKVEVITLQPRQPFTITGIVGVSEDRDSLGGETYVMFTEPRAQRLMLGRPDVYSNVDLKAKPGVTPERLKANVQQVLGGDYEALTAEETAVEQAGPIETFLNVFKIALSVFGLLGLITGVFLIFNTFSMLVAQRTRELALYRSFGANRQQVLKSVLVESLLLGLVSSVVGLIVGIGLGWLLKWGLGEVGGNPLPGSGVVVRPIVVVATLLAGILITMLAALLPAIRASRVAPLEAMRDAAKPDKPLRGLTITGLAVLVAGLVLLVLRGSKAVDNNLLTLGLGSLLVFLGAVMLAPALSRPITRFIGKPVDRAMPGRLGVRNTGRNPRRTALTAAALMIGVTLATGAGLFASSVKSGVTDLFQQDLNADLTLQADFSAGPTAGFDPALQQRLQAIPGVEAATAIRGDTVRMAGRDTVASALDPFAAQTLFSVKAKAGEVRALNPGEVILPDGFAEQAGLPVGQSTTMRAARGESKNLTVVGIIEPNQLVTGPIISEQDASGFRSPLAQQAYVKVTDESQVDSVRQQMNALVANNPEVSVGSPADQLKQATAFLDLLLLILNFLLGLTILVAVLGVINTLLLSVFERTRELGMLRAVGMSRSRVSWMITVESILISLFGALMGMVLGTALGIALVKILGGDFLRLTIPWGYLVITLVAAIVVGVLAALLPAARAARLNVLQAIAYE
ncbi:MAG TPA: FtsX-like permease family protein [Candidatus Limnocylindrales bacterium]|nr:FtsX-like permease family protein [Candidatus Limnocylindrales bacterium]